MISCNPRYPFQGALNWLIIGCWVISGFPLSLWDVTCAKLSRLAAVLNCLASWGNFIFPKDIRIILIYFCNFKNPFTIFEVLNWHKIVRGRPLRQFCTLQYKAFLPFWKNLEFLLVMVVSTRADRRSFGSRWQITLRHGRFWHHHEFLLSYKFGKLFCGRRSPIFVVDNPE